MAAGNGGPAGPMGKAKREWVREERRPGSSSADGVAGGSWGRQGTEEVEGGGQEKSVDADEAGLAGEVPEEFDGRGRKGAR